MIRRTNLLLTSLIYIKDKQDLPRNLPRTTRDLLKNVHDIIQFKDSREKDLITIVKN